MKKKILIPVDINNNTIVRKLADHITCESANNNADFYFLTVVPRYSCYDILTGVWREQSEHYKIKKAENKLREITSVFSLPEACAHYHVSMGIPMDEILAYSKWLPADLIIIPSNFPEFSTFFFGSTASAVVRHSTCAVLVVR